MNVLEKTISFLLGSIGLASLILTNILYVAPECLEVTLEKQFIEMCYNRHLLMVLAIVIAILIYKLDTRYRTIYSISATIALSFTIVIGVCQIMAEHSVYLTVLSSLIAITLCYTLNTHYNENIYTHNSSHTDNSVGNS